MTRPAPEVLHRPSDADLTTSAMSRYLRSRGFSTYEDAWRWSVADIEGFWASMWDWFGVQAGRPYERVLAGGARAMPGARWFPGAELNYVDQARRWQPDRVAVVFRSEHRAPVELTYGELFGQVACVAAGLRRLGVGRGDRVAAYAPNTPETLIAFLAAASIGAIWSACSPDFGAQAVLDRFRQIEPSVLIAADGYRYKGRSIDRRDVVAQLERGLPSLGSVVVVPELGGGTAEGGPAWDDLVAGGEGAAGGEPEPVPFEHPLWVLFSSGTTGLPKPIVHGHGGVLLEHLKVLSLHLDAGPGDRFFWHTSTGWMMWNLLAGGLLVGATIVLWDGSPAHPDLGALWRMAEEAGVSYFGTSAPYLQACARAGVVPRAEADLSMLRAVGSTGAPLGPEGFRWVYEHVANDVLLGSVSGGTDLCTAFVGSCPTLPVHAGEIQCRCLGAKVEAWDERGRPVVDEVGELVITEPMPSMPLRFWHDPGGERYRASYFSTYPGVWRHGDWVRVTDRGSCVITGRSDATLNRSGVRMGTSELYTVVESLPEVADSLAVDTGVLGHEGRLYLFVVLAAGAELDDRLRAAIAHALRTALSPRHVPDEIIAIPEVPRTLNGKKLEVPVRRILLGSAAAAVVSPGAMASPGTLDPFVTLAKTLHPSPA